MAQFLAKSAHFFVKMEQFKVKSAQFSIKTAQFFSFSFRVLFESTLPTPSNQHFGDLAAVLGIKGPSCCLPLGL